MRVVSSKSVPEEVSGESDLRPRRFSEFIGQEKVKHNLEISIIAAQKRKEALDHVLVYGPPGLGKTTLRQVKTNLEGAFAIRTWI